MDEQAMRTIIQILRQKLADAEWENVQLQAEVIRLTTEQTQPDEGQPG